MMINVITSSLAAAVVGLASLLTGMVINTLDDVSRAQVSIIETLGRFDERLKAVEKNQ